MNKKIILLPLLLLLVGGGSLLWHRTQEGDGRVRASGTIEVTEVQVMPQIGGRLLTLHIQEGQQVKKDQLIAKLSLDGLDDREQGAQAQLLQAEERLKELQSGSRTQEVQEARARVRALASLAQQAQTDETRYNTLQREGVVSRREAELFSQSARVAREDLKAAQARLGLLEEGNRKETIEQQKSAVQAAKSAVKLAQTDLSHKLVVAPVSGLVLAKNYEQGEVVGVGSPIATIGVMEECWVKLYIPSTQIGLVRVGQSVDVRIDAYPQRPFMGSVRAISQQAEYNPRLSLTQDERANQVFWVKVALSNDEGIMKPGMPADALFLP